MKKIMSVAAAAMMVSAETFAGGLLTNTNQSVAFLRNPARDAAIGIDGVYSNPAGISFLNKGFHLGLNIQSAYQSRDVTSTFGGFVFGQGNNSLATKKFEGDAKAPVIPSIQAAYNWDKWAVSFNFALGGGGGKCEFANGLGSFESIVALLPMVGKDMGINTYSLDSYMKGRQYYYQFQLGANYKINSHLAAYVGGRLTYASNNYYGYVKNIMINDATGGMVSAPNTFAALSNDYKEKAGAAAEKAQNYADQAQALLAAGDEANAAAAAAAAQQYADGAKKAKDAAVTTGTLAVATQDITLNCDQSAFGFAPVLGLDFNYGKWNIAAKYEFRSRLNLENKAANSESAANMDALAGYRDGVKNRGDIPSLLTVGVQYEPCKSLRLSAGAHWYGDKKAKSAGDKNALLSRDTYEVLAGAEYDINNYLQVSAGWQTTQYGLTDKFLSDMSFIESSNSVGLGLGIRVAKCCKINVAYFQTFYKTYDKTVDDYNNTSAVIAKAAGEATAQAMVGAGMLKGTDSFKRKNKVFGIGVELDF